MITGNGALLWMAALGASTIQANTMQYKDFFNGTQMLLIVFRYPTSN
jgi:hypothetical protein